MKGTMKNYPDKIFVSWPVRTSVCSVGQTFLSAGSGDFLVASSATRNTGLESPVNRQAGKPALHISQ